MISKLLIANRGEIACRIIRTAQRMGIATVAVYSAADHQAQHVLLADEAFLLGAAPARESYLCADKIVNIAQLCGADAVHPGYGFLSENADFARTLARAGIEFVGPPVSAIEAMGSKSAAKNIMQQAGVPLVAGYHGEDQNPALLRRHANTIGYPVLLKAVAGGGGKGMRVVTGEAQFDAALLSCQRESQSSFGNDRVLLEQYLTKPRHVEIQVFADKHGNVVHLFERDCSIQRRHQKVIEEAPAPSIPNPVRVHMGQVAIQAAQAIGYVGAGTVEFLYDSDDSFYFMEMNTRLQVEHPVTEMITGEDLVEWQLMVAAGERLPKSQDQLKVHGHAFEARIYAEDPRQDFLPATGRIDHLSFPAPSVHVRIDSGIVSGDEIGIFYDPMLAKLIVWDTDRASALKRLRTALSQTQLAGPATNLDFLGLIASNAAFANLDLDTGFIARHTEQLLPRPSRVPTQVLVMAALFTMLARQRSRNRNSRNDCDQNSPWRLGNGWRLNKDNFHSMNFGIGPDETLEQQILVHFRTTGFEIEIDTERFLASGSLAEDGALIAIIDGHRSYCRVIEIGTELTLFIDNKTYRIQRIAAGQDVADERSDGALTAPMPGAVIAVNVNPGDPVEAGDTLLVLEAMKMEHSICAPVTGTVEAVYFALGDQVEEGAQLARVKGSEKA